MTGRWWTNALWVVVAAAAVWWGVRAVVDDQPREAVLAATGAAPAVAPPGVIDQNPVPPLPAAAADPVPVGRFELFKVNLPTARSPNGEAAALIGVDGLPPKTYRVGDTVVGAVVLQSVQSQSAALGPANGPAAVVLRLSQPATSSGALPSANGADSRQVQADGQPPIRAASAPPVNRTAVPVSDPDHGVDTSNR